jgi:hypothetical protein
MKKQLLVAVSLGVLVLLNSCSKDPLKDMTEEESRIYITNYDTSLNYSTYRTFSIADSVAVIRNNQLSGRQRTAVDAQFVDAVAAALQQRGYTRVANDQSPDLGVTISRITNTSTGIVSYNDYGGFYGSYWDPYYWGAGGYSYFFPTYYGVYQVNESALAIDMFDLRNKAQNNSINSVWSGLIRGSGIFNTQTAASQVAELFNQSSYLRAQ